MKTVQNWVSEFNRIFGLDVYIKHIDNDVGIALLEILTPTEMSIYMGTIELRKRNDEWKFAGITSPFGGTTWAFLTNI